MSNPTAATAITTMSTLTDQEFFLLLAAGLMVVQVLYRIWDKNDSKMVIEAIRASSLAAATQMEMIVKSFEPHLERSRRIYGIVKDLKGMHDVRDDDGRFIWYMPKEIIETQRELTQLTHVVATTQKHMARLMERQESMMNTGHEDLKKIIVEHQESCKNQFHTLKDNIKETK